MILLQIGDIVNDGVPAVVANDAPTALDVVDCTYGAVRGVAVDNNDVVAAVVDENDHDDDNAPIYITTPSSAAIVAAVTPDAAAAGAVPATPAKDHTDEDMAHSTWGL